MECAFLSEVVQLSRLQLVTLLFPSKQNYELWTQLLAAIQQDSAQIYVILKIGKLQWTINDSSSVGIATDYGLDGPGSNPCGDEIFRPSKRALGPTQPPVQWVPSLSPGVEAAGARGWPLTPI